MRWLIVAEWAPKPTIVDTEAVGPIAASLRGELSPKKECCLESLQKNLAALQ